MKLLGKNRRHGVAAVELAVCLPAIVVLVLGSIETCTMMFVRQSLQISAYESVRRAVKPEGSNQDSLDRCHQVLAERGVQGAEVDITPTNVENAAKGQHITVRVSAPTQPNSVLKLMFFTGNLDAEVTMVKE